MLIDREEDLEITLSADFDERSNTSFYTADNDKRHLKAPEELVSGCRERKENLQALAKLGAAVDDVVNVNKCQC